MILKKPYAFLIKHFKLIHIILAIPIIYIVNKTRYVVKFFNEYVANKYTFQTGSDISSLYVSGLMLFSVFIIIVAALAIYFLLKYKEKPVKMYVFIILYYILLFIVLFYLSGVISSMSREALAVKTARLYRDISLLIYYPQYIFVVFVVLRAVGFNIKQFNFKSDLKELNITSADNEEVEIGFELDGYKTKRFLRRYKREFGYYIAENKFMITICVIIIIFSSILVYYKTRENYNTTYTQTDSFMHQGFSLNVLDSIVSNLSYNGDIINGEYYLAIKVNITNNMGSKEKFDYNSLLLQVGNKTIKPVLDRSDYFQDYGAPYYAEVIEPDKPTDYVFVYPIDKKDIKKSFKLKVLSSFNMRKNRIVTNYAIVNLSPVVIDEIIDIKTAKLNERISFNNTNVGTTILSIKDFKRGTSYIYDYKYCKKDDTCETKKDMVSINYNVAKGNTSLIAFGYDFDLDKETSYAKHLKNDNSFFKDFIKVRVEDSNNEYKEYSVIDITPKNLSDKIVLQVDGDVLSSEKVDLVITVRNKRYVVNLL